MHPDGEGVEAAALESCAVLSSLQRVVAAVEFVLPESIACLLIFELKKFWPYRILSWQDI